MIITLSVIALALLVKNVCRIRKLCFVMISDVHVHLYALLTCASLTMISHC